MHYYFVFTSFGFAAAWCHYLSIWQNMGMINRNSETLPGGSASSFGLGSAFRLRAIYLQSINDPRTILINSGMHFSDWSLYLTWQDTIVWCEMDLR
jgi:hypothetical protein